MTFSDDRTPEQRERDIVRHQRRIQQAVRQLRRAGYNPKTTPASKCDKILENNS